MELAKITSKGQITLPIRVRRSLKLNDGDKVAFIEKDGIFIVANPITFAFENAQKAFEGEAERIGLADIDDVVALIKGVRAERRDRQP